MRENQTNTESTSRLWEMIVRDDEKAFKKLFDLFYPSLCVYAKNYIEERAVREDIVQDVFVVLWEDRKTLLITGALRNYLLVAVRNRCFNYIRKQGLFRQYEASITIQESDADTEDIYLLSELYEILENTLSRLPDAYRIVFEMQRMEGKDYQEIADKLNISVRTAKRYKSLVVEVLQKELKDYLPLILMFFYEV